MLRRFILAERQAHSRWLTTADVAKQLLVSRRRVRQLAHGGDLAFEWTRSGQMIFHLDAVRRCGQQRADARTRNRSAVLAGLHLQMARVGVEPRQLRFESFYRPSLRLVLSPEGERSFPDRVTKGARSFEKSARSERGSSVNPKRWRVPDDERERQRPAVSRDRAR